VHDAIPIRKSGLRLESRFHAMGSFHHGGSGAHGTKVRSGVNEKELLKAGLVRGDGPTGQKVAVHGSHDLRELLERVEMRSQVDMPERRRLKVTHEHAEPLIDEAGYARFDRL
jgi:hypothetical protein